MYCPICLGSSNANAFKTKRCKQQFHVTCVDQWVTEDKFSCPLCQDEGNFLASLPFQKFKLINVGSEQPLPSSYKGQVITRVLLTKALDDMFKLGTRWYLTSNEVLGASRITN